MPHVRHSVHTHALSNFQGKNLLISSFYATQRPESKKRCQINKRKQWLTKHGERKGKLVDYVGLVMNLWTLAFHK